MNKLQNILMTQPIINLGNDDKLIDTKIEEIANNYPFIILNERQLCDYEMIHNKGFHPLTGFMIKQQYVECVNQMTLPSGDLWPIPINLHITEKWILDNLINKEQLKGNKYLLRDIIKSKDFKNYLKSTYTVLKHETGIPLAIMKNENIYEPDLYNEANKVYNAITQGEMDFNHPYVKILTDYQKAGMIYCIGGKFIASNDVPRYDFKELRMSPAQLKEKFKELGWINNNDEYNSNIIGFQTRNPLHKSHFQLTKFALDEATKLNGKPSKLLLHPVVGVTQICDINYHTRVKCYKELIKKYNTGEAILSLLPLSMRMAGPREAIRHAIIRKNYGVTHFVVGRDHAGPSSERFTGGKFYGPYDAQNELLQNAKKIKIIPIVSKMIVFFNES